MKKDVALLGAMVLVLLMADLLAFHDILEPHSLKDWLILSASVLAIAYCLTVSLRGSRTTR